MKGVADGDTPINVPSEDLNGPQIVSPVNFMEKYGDERNKRIKAEGSNQYIDLRRSERFKRFIEDPWVDHLAPINVPVPDGGHCKVLIVGAGFGGILFAVRLIQAGLKPGDLVIVDPAGGFGGTWYWNRYPGLMCDVESYIYLPLLEEMGYMPKRRYASGVEIRQYVESICSKYGLHERSMFQSSGRTMDWDESSKEWVVSIAKKPKGGEESMHTVRANFVVIASGLLSNAKLPDLDGIDDFRGYMFHTARWDYRYTGGSPEDPSLTALRGKKIAIIGTGATAVQAVPELAKYASQLYVFQRTPSSVDVRDNRDTDPDWFKNNVATKKGWQRERTLNFTAYLEDAETKPAPDLVNDGWSNMRTFRGLLGTSKVVNRENVVEYIGELHALDQPRQRRLHQRIEEIVNNTETANGLKAWYPSWCKRPCFHDEYLQAFNSSNVSLVDTNGKGVDRITEKGVEFDGKEYEVDLIIWSTGFGAPGSGSAAGTAQMTVNGRAGLDMEKVNEQGDLLSLHGIVSRGFPNLFWTGPLQAAANASNTFLLDNLATHVSYIMNEAMQKADNGKGPAVEPTAEAQESWANEIASGAMTFAAMSGCTPSYYNREGMADQMTMEEKMKAARHSVWPNGFENYLNLLEQWRADGAMKGLEVRVAG